MKHTTCLCAGTLLACLALSNAYASTPRHFLPYTADVSVPAHSAGSENPLVADRDDHREQMRQQRQLERRERMHRAEDRYQQGKMRQEQERMIREQRRTEREQAVATASIGTTGIARTASGTTGIAIIREESTIRIGWNVSGGKTTSITAIPSPAMMTGSTAPKN